MNVQLIDTRTDAHVWAEQYDRDLNGIFAIQSDIAERVAQQLGEKSHPLKNARRTQADQRSRCF